MVGAASSEDFLVTLPSIGAVESCSGRVQSATSIELHALR